MQFWLPFRNILISRKAQGGDTAKPIYSNLQQAL